MPRIAFFGHDVTDAAVRRRVQSFVDDGLEVTGFMMRRKDGDVPGWKNFDLGETRDGAFIHRIRSIFSGARIAASHGDELAKADAFYARNLDMLATAFLARRKAKLNTPVIYESLDIHRLLTRNDLVGTLMRRLEGWLLGMTSGLVVSSPGFLKHHFCRHYPGRFRAFLVENRLAAGAAYGPRPPAEPFAGQKLRLGWVGILRCQRSFDLLAALAAAFPDTVEVHLHGLPARREIPVFEPRIDAIANMTYHGRYRSPEDLAAIYAGLDVVWAGDFMEAGMNSVWLLPNRIYEGGYFGTPPIAPSGTETAAWIDANACGFILPEPLGETLPQLVRDLLSDRGQIEAKRRQLLGLPVETFRQPPGFMADIVRSALQVRTAI
jgi:succinoglycan biosynthesis protein ExoL